jgi:hypothetical protein
MACFSPTGDSLSQWRAYGKVSLGFTPSLTMFGQLPEMVIGRVLYGREEQRKIIHTLAHHHHLAYQHDLNNSDEKILPFYTRAALILGRIYQRISLFKDRAFSDERECRLIYLEGPAGFDEKGRTATKRFRVSGNLIVPYVATRDIAPEVERLPLKRVIIGPQENQDLVFSGVREFLDTPGYNTVEVEKSSIPFRPTRTV